MGSRWGVSAKTLPAAALSLVYATAEYCAPIWCRSAHTRLVSQCAGLINSVLNEALRIVIGCLHPTPTNHLPILSSIQPAELRRLKATLSLARRDTLDLYHTLHGQLAGLQNFPRNRLKSRSPFVLAARKLLNDLSKLDIRAAQHTKYRWSAVYSKCISVLHVLIPKNQF